MTDATFSDAAAPARLGYLEPTFSFLTVILLAMMVPTLLAMGLDERSLEGVSIWMKPLKFEVALVIYCATLAVFARWMPKATRESRRWRWFMYFVSLCIIGEMIWIGGAAAAGTTSHFNIGSPAMAAIYGLMGAFAVGLTSASLVMGISILRNNDVDMNPVLQLSVALGLILTFGLTLVTAGYMSSQPGHFVGTPTTGAMVPFMGWSREVGDLRVAHFFATHAMHALPLVGLLALGLAQPIGRRLVWAAAAGFSALVAGLFVQALMGMPVI